MASNRSNGQVGSDSNFDDLLHYSNTAEPISIMVAAGTVDAGSDDPACLRKGLVLCKLESGPNAGLYVPFDSAGTDGEADLYTAVVLEHDTEVPADNNHICLAYMHGTFWADKVIAGAGFDRTQCPHIRLMSR